MTENTKKAASEKSSFEKERDVLVPLEDEIQVDRKMVKVREFNFGQTLRLGKRISGVISAITDKTTMAELADSIYGSDAAIEILVESLDIPREEVEQLDTDTALIAIQKTIEVNPDFFSGKVTRSLLALTVPMVPGA